MGEFDLAGIRLCKGDEVLHGFIGGVGTGHNDDRQICKLAEWIEIIDLIGEFVGEDRLQSIGFISVQAFFGGL